ncbi:MAG: universal stress protein [Chloroflexota bacterium]|nr:universal stress protein [Chloroflexota bacterium]
MTQQANGLIYTAAIRDFREARRQAVLEDLKARVTGKSDDLLSYEEIRQLLRAEPAAQRNLEDIPIDSIVGSVGRYSDFTRRFMPRRDSDEERWARVKLKMLYGGGLPPIEVFKVGDVYFVLDGNHRVSVARQQGATTIEAYVTEVDVRVPLAPNDKPDNLIIKASYAHFLETTGLDETRPAAQLTVTAAGQYRVLIGQINLYRQLLSLQAGHDVDGKRASAEWYDNVYFPVIGIIRELGILDDFPGRTETDLYVWVSERQQRLEDTLGWQVGAEAAAVDLASGHSPRLTRIIHRLGERLAEAVTPTELDAGPVTGQWRKTQVAVRRENRLFPRILVSVSGTERGWQALDQALVVAAKEGSALQGLHVIRSSSQTSARDEEHVLKTFQDRCHAAGVPGNLRIETGQRIARNICSRARWTDLVVANLAFPPGQGPVGKLGSGFHTLIGSCPRPVLAVPQVSRLSRAVLAYDGSPKSREALYVAAYLSGHWQMPLIVLTVIEKDRTSRATLREAQAYLESRGVQATPVAAEGPVGDSILQTVEAQAADLVIIGGYGHSPLLEVVLGSAVDQLLQRCRQPMLVCR